MSHFCDYEHLLLNDGCTGTAIISAAGPMEVQFDEHKLLVVYARDLAPFERILIDAAIPRQALATPKTPRKLLVLDLCVDGGYYHASIPDGNIKVLLT